MAVSVLIADDHDIVRTALKTLLDASFGITVVGVTVDAGAAVAEASRLKPEVVLMDIEMPGADPFQSASQILELCPGTKVLFLSGASNDHYIDQALKSGASGYMSKADSVDLIPAAILQIHEGGTCFSDRIEQRIQSDGFSTLGEELTERELETLRYIARGHSQKEIASLMHVSVKTIEKHSASLMSKLEVRDRVGLVRYAIREGIINA